MKRIAIFFLFISCLFIGCADDNNPYEIIEKPEPISVDLENVPYATLSEYHFFTGDLKNLTPHEDLLLYKPNSELFTDYARKTRYVWLPENAKANYTYENTPLNLPIGSVLIKIFYYDETQLNSDKKIIETRLMILKDEGWIFANYKWNEEQSEAYFDMSESTIPLSINHLNETINFDYKIPNESQCMSCHSINNELVPIGIKPIHLNYTLTYPDGNENQLNRWIQRGKLEDNLPDGINAVVDYSDISKPISERARAYFDIQCAHCHQTGGEAISTPLNLSYHQTTFLKNMGVCVDQPHPIPGVLKNGKIVDPQNPENSLLYLLMNTDDTYLRMPRLGRSTIHREGVQLIEEWINSLEECE